ncbi:circularly permuted type 2 ATP-grasp protein [Williamsia sp.]|uniref:circularly permuted type 2 ATP-grasp protein n=1 Tax=Williamsia sp. TaxID=1872085 RepID=UPI0025E75C05|nr:circularly permuted type 2 ATP-grasp protein [Williamsia sp.]
MTSPSPTPAETPSAVVDRYRSDRFALFDIDGPDAATPPYDEMIDSGGSIRPQWADLVAGYARAGTVGMARTAMRLRTMVADEGITYNLTGDRVASGDAVVDTTRLWELDSVPLVLDGDAWAAVEAGIAQRCLLLDALLVDLYGERRTIAEGLVPPEMVFGHPGYVRKAGRLGIAGPHALFCHAADIGRTADGGFALWGDYTQAPSGIGYAIADRRLTSRAASTLFGAVGPRPMTTFAGTLRLALFDYAPPGVDDPTVVVLSPGSLSETAFDQAYLASVLGVPLVESADLLVRDGAVYMRSLGSFKRVDVILRRVDAMFCDPLDLRSDSRLGVAGLVEAVARGAVTVVNTLGSGVIENPALHTVAARLAPALIDEELALPTVETYWGGAGSERSKIIADLNGLVLDNFRTGEQFIGATLSGDESETVRRRVEADPWQWVGRRPGQFSVAPSMTPAHAGAAARLRAAPVGIRTFAVAQGSAYAVMPGGMGQVLATGAEGAAMGAIAAKDVWVANTEALGDTTRVAESVSSVVSPVLSATDRSAASPRVLADLFWLGRHGERAELTVRMVKVARERYQDRDRLWMSGTGSLPLFLAGIATTTATTDHVGALPDAATADNGAAVALAAIGRLTMSRSVPGTVAHAVDRLVASARAVRDQMSTSTWMVLGTIERAFADLAHTVAESAPATGAHAGTSAAVDTVDVDELARAHESILHGLLALAGLQAESMVHDPAWLFMDVGRRIERTVMLADLTRAVLVERHDLDVEQGLLEAYLVANESAVIYRRRNRGLHRLRPVIMLAMFDETNPRSMIYQLARLRSDLSTMPDEVRSAAAERVVEEMIAELRRVDPTDLTTVGDTDRRDELAELMTTLASGAREISDVLGRTRFAPPRDIQPLWGGGSR